ncbi:MAG: DUF952 domain-containing protein [Pirellulaceae bacterium]|nr:DUF952 domain-containing protein [Pirellulaceae bacterium]
MSTNWVYKIMTAGQWDRLRTDGVWAGSEVDLRDGFVHLSTWEQVPGTLEKHFGGQSDLQLVGVPEESVRHELRWEVSRGGQEFPHLYRELRRADVGNRRAIEWDGTRHRIAATLISGRLEASGLSNNDDAAESDAGQLDLRYPYYLLHHGQGYVSLVDVQSSIEPRPQALALFSTYQRAAEFLEQIAGFAGIKAIRNGRELHWLLTSLKEPVAETVLDPAVDRPEISGTWRRTVVELLRRHIEIDNSPWNYPVFLLRSGRLGETANGGWSSIQAGAGSHWFSFVVLFTGEVLAEAYRKEIEPEDGWLELVTVPDMRCLRERLVELGAGIAGIAVNPTVDGGARKCEKCLEIGRLLAHYLTVGRAPDEDNEGF